MKIFFSMFIFSSSKKNLCRMAVATLLHLVEALIEKYLVRDSVQNSVPSNTAARILGGDTVHALCKLPFGSLTGKRGQLSKDVLWKHRERRKQAQFLLDEFSMLGRDDTWRARRINVG